MASLLRSVACRVPPAQLLRLSRLGAVPARNCGWVRDWKPGPPPKTKEEREAAAKKYNLIPEDYEVHDASEGYGDYPKLPPVGQDARDPFEDFDHHYRRLNYGETLHVDYDAYTSDRHDPNEKYRYTPFQMITGFFAFVFGFSAIMCFGFYYDIRIVQPMKPKQYPGPGKIHYTFEPAE